MPGQPVRLSSSLFNHRLHGHASALVERIEPWGHESLDTSRRYTVWAAVIDSPVALRLGSRCQAEVLVGRKPVYRIILEH